MRDVTQFNFIVVKVYRVVQNVNDLFFIHANDVTVSKEANISLKSPIYSFYNNNDDDTQIENAKHCFLEITKLATRWRQSGCIKIKGFE